ncbi:hypothetical protein [Nostoc sp.]|uniref:hypothetical protein n=1 Tax=Nostoc sp. TaxID=1180 RepID=UPI002FF408A8
MVVLQSDAPLLQSSDAYGGLRQPIAQPLLYERLRQRQEPPLNASSFKWGNPTNGLARLCAIYAPAVLVKLLSLWLKAR